MMHSRSAKSVGAQPHYQSLSGKSRFVGTVPQPFRFDTREKVRPKTIRERKVEAMIEEQRLTQSAKQTFRCKPIPSNVLEPRFEKLMADNERRRQKVKRESLKITQEREAPFSFWNRDKEKMMRRSESYSAPPLNAECRQPAFKANPIPKSCTVLVYKQTVEKQEQDRKKRIHEQAEISYAKASMPSRMQKAANRESEKPKAKDPIAEMYTF